MSDSKFINVLKQILTSEKVDASQLNQEEQEIVMALVKQRDECFVLKDQYYSLQSRLENLLDVLVEFAQFNFDMEIPLSENADELDGIALGLQTLGQEVEFYQSQLQLSNENLKEAQRMADIGSWEISVPSLDMIWSDHLYTIYGFTERGNEMDRLIELVDDADNSVMGDLFDRAVKFHEPYDYIFTVTVDGKEKHIEAQANPIVVDGKVTKVVGTAMDITDRVISQRKLEALNLDLEQKVVERTKDLEGFSYTVSHDLRAPLRSIIGFSTILDEDYGKELTPDAKRILDIIVKNASKMSTLIEELLSFSRVGVTVARFDRLDLNQIIESTWAEVLAPFDGKDKVKLEIVKLPDVKGTQAMIQQVFTNIFSNSLKYSSKEDVIHIKIQIESEADGKLKFSITDNGCGFDMKYHDKLFGVFQRLHSEDEYAGTGVGLALVKRIVDKHQGEIYAESEVGKGAKFFVSLPLAK